MCRVKVKENIEWLKSAFIGSAFGAAGLREELEHVMAERTLQMRNLMMLESKDKDNQDGDDEEGVNEDNDDWGSYQEEEKEVLKKEDLQKPEEESGACTGLDMVRRIVA
jgi:hypothetical protein